MKNFLSLSTSEVLSRFIGFITTAYMARVLSSAAFGKVNFVEAIITYFLVIVNPGLSVIGIREIARDREHKEDYISTITALKFILFFLAILILFVLIFLIDKPYEIKLLIFLYGLTLLPASFLIDWVFNGLEKMEYTALTNIAARALFMILVISIVKSASHVFAIPLIKLVTDTFIVISLILIFNRSFGKIRFSFDRKLAWDVMKAALPLGYSFCMIGIYYSAGTIMLGFMRDDQTVGYYNAASKITLFLIAFSGAFYSAIFPVMSSYYKSSFERLRDFQKKVIKMLVTVALPLGIGVSLLAPRIISFIYGSEYLESVKVLQLLIWAVVIIYINVPFANSMVAMDKQNKLAVAVTIGALTSLSLNFFLIPSLGMTGAAIANICAEFAVFVFSYITMKKATSGDPFIFMPKPLLASLIMGLFIFLFGARFQIFLAISLSAAVYILALYIVRGISQEDIRFIKEKIF